MVSTRSSRRKLAVLLLAGTAAAVVIALFVKDWHLVLAHYYSYKLDNAQTYDEALPALEAIAEKAGMTGTSSVLLGKLGTAHPKLTVWFFAWADRGQTSSQRLLEDFGQRLELDEKLLACWSQYVRWHEGAQLGSYLDRIAPPPQDEQGEGVRIVCGTSLIGLAGLAPRTSTSSVGWRINLPREEPTSGLRILGLAWYLGMWPLPKRGSDCEQEFTKWLTQPAPFLRHLDFDETLGRCKREMEAAPLPELQPYSERDLPVPEIPVPGWTGPLPADPDDPMTETLIIPSTPTPPAPIRPARDKS